MTLRFESLGLSLLLACPLIACDPGGNSVGATATTTGTGSGSTSGGAPADEETGDEPPATGTSTGGEPDGSTGFFPSDGECEQTATVVGLEDANVTDRTAQQVLDVALGEYAGGMEWFAEGPVQYQGDLGPSGATVELSYAGGEARSVEGVLVEACEHDGPCPCPSLLEIDAGMRITTEDGTIDETYAVVLTYSEGDDSGFNPSGITIRHPFDPDASGGSLSTGDFSVDEAFEITELSFDLGVDNAGVLGGSIFVEVEGMGSIGAGPIARFSTVSSAEACVALPGGVNCQLAGCTEVAGRPVSGRAPEMCSCDPPQQYCVPGERVGGEAGRRYTRAVGPDSDPFDEVVQFGVSTDLGGDWRACADAPDVALCGCTGSCE